MRNIVHIDCTLRDGGYYNNWDFSEDLINQYLKVMKFLNIDFCEIGYRFSKNNGFKGSCAFTSEDFLMSLDIPNDLNIAIMIDAKELQTENNFSKETLLRLVPVPAIQSKVALIRLACPIDLLGIVHPAFKILKDLGYKTALNITHISEKKDSDLLNLKRYISKEYVDVLYFADTVGSLIPDIMRETINKIRKSWSGELGFHAHNNKGLALINTLKSIEEDVSWVDSTVTGIGRGPGNTKTEELFIELNKEIDYLPNLVPLVKLINDRFLPLQKKYQWGSNIFYYLAGEYSIHPSYIQSMIQDNRYDENDILASLNNLKKSDGKISKYRGLDDTKKFYLGDPTGSWSPRKVFKNKDIFIIGTGSLVRRHEKAIINFIKKYKPITLAINTQTLSDNNLIDYRVACHPTRLLADKAMHLKLSQPLIIPLSNLPKQFFDEFKNKKILDFGIGVSSGYFDFHENYCLVPNSLVLSYALSICVSGKANKIYLAGFDGYQNSDSRNEEINELLIKFKTYSPESNLIAITPTKYKNIVSKSIYGI